MLQVAYLYHDEHKTHGEIQGILNLSPYAVKSNLNLYRGYITGRRAIY